MSSSIATVTYAGLDGEVCPLDVDDQAVSQDDAYVRHAVNLERADLEWLRSLRRRSTLGEGGAELPRASVTVRIAVTRISTPCCCGERTVRAPEGV
jgi:hypothetical protein